MNYANIIPLVGGMTIANQNVIGKKPDMIYSYEAFARNDSHILRYLNYDLEKYQVIDRDDVILKNFDIVTTVCPCAGLSMLNSGNRGADASQNDWMYKSAEFVLSRLRPQVFFGENAPGLFQDSGRAVRDRLKEIGLRNGYNLILYKTSSILHGIPQNRVRSYYFFVNDVNYFPTLPFISKSTKNLYDFLDEASTSIHNNDILSDTYFNNIPYKQSSWFEFLNEIGILEGDYDQMYEFKTIFNFILKNNLSTKFSNYLSKNNKENELKKFIRAINKIDNGFGVMDGSPHFAIDYTNALYYRAVWNLLNIKELRYFTVREMMLLMGLPSDFALDGSLKGKDINHIFQNVPVKTTEDMTRFAIDIIDRKFENYNDGSLKINKTLRINNVNKKIFLD